MGSSSGTQSNDNDGLPYEPNATSAKAYHISALEGQYDDVTLPHNKHWHNTCKELEHIREDVDLGIMNGIYSECTCRKFMKIGNWMDEQLEVAILAVDVRAPIKRIAKIHGIPIMSL